MAEIDVTVSEVRSLQGEQLLALCRQVALEMNRLEGLQAVIANQIWLASEGCSSQDTLAKRLGCRSSVELIQRLTGESARVVSARVVLGRQTAVRTSFLGEELPPPQEHVAEALESGYLNADSANHISRVIAKNTSAANVDDIEIAERALVQAATGLDFGTGDAPGVALHADDIRRLCLKWDEALDPDGAAPDEVAILRKRFLNVGPTKDGMARISGLLTAEVAAAYGAVLDSLNNPRVPKDGLVPELMGGNPVAPTGSFDEGGVCPESFAATSKLGLVLGEDSSENPSEDSARVFTDDLTGVLANDPTDVRTPGQKRHDALATALNVALASRDLPVLQGASATIVVEVKEENFSGIGRAGRSGNGSWGRSGSVLGDHLGGDLGNESGDGSRDGFGRGLGNESGSGSGDSLDSVLVDHLGGDLGNKSGGGSGDGFGRGLGNESGSGTGDSLDSVLVDRLGGDLRNESAGGSGDGLDHGSGGPAWLITNEGVPARIPMRAVDKMSCGAVIQAVVRDSLGRITALGTPARIFTASQRRAIALRDGGCVIPGCTVPAAWCEVHHVAPHALGGPTHTDNGVLLCRFHHSTIDTSGWEIAMKHGIPSVKPPDWLMNLYPGDPRQDWVNQVLADQTRRIREKLEGQKSRGRPCEREPNETPPSGFPPTQFVDDQRGISCPAVDTTSREDSAVCAA